MTAFAVGGELTDRFSSRASDSFGPSAQAKCTPMCLWQVEKQASQLRAKQQQQQQPSSTFGFLTFGDCRVRNSDSPKSITCSTPFDSLNTTLFALISL